MLGLKITQTNGTFDLVSDTNVLALKFATVTTTGDVLLSPRITNAEYFRLSGTVTTNYNDTVAQYNGANVLYEWGQLDESGTFQAVCDNR